MKIKYALLLLALFACTRPSPDPAPEALSAETTAWLTSQLDAILEQCEADEYPENTPALLDSALSCAQTLRKPEKWLDALELYCGYFIEQTDYQAAYDLLESAIQKAWWGEDGRKGRLYYWQGFVLRQLGRNYAAARLYEQAKTLSDRYGNVVVDENPAGPIYKTLANIKTRLGENEEAEKLLTVALDLLRTDTLPENALSNALTRANIHSDLGIAHQNAGLTEKALREYEAGLAALPPVSAAPSDDPEMTARLSDTRGMLLSNKAGALALLGRLPEAELHVHTALATITPRHTKYRFSAMCVHAEIEEKIGRTAEADAARASAWNFARARRDDIETREVAKLVVTRGWSAYSQKHYREAVRFAQQALNLLYPDLSPDNPLQNPNPANFDPDPENTIAEALDLKGEAQWQLYQSDRDSEYLRLADSTTALAILMMENLRNAAVYESSKLGSARQSRTLFSRMFRILYAQQAAGNTAAAERAFVFSEKNKAVLLHQKVSADAALRAAGVQDSLIRKSLDLKEQWAELRNRIYRYRLSGGAENDSSDVVLNRQLYQIEVQQQNLRRDIANRYKLPPDGRNAKTASAAEVQRRLLRDDEIWISYFSDRDSSQLYLVAIAPDAVRLTRKPYRDEYVPDFLKNFNNAGVAENRSGDPTLRTEFIRQSRHLYETLLLPAFSENAPPRRLALSPDGALALLPFDVLLCRQFSPDAAADYAALPYLARECQTRFVPSASLELFYAGLPRAAHTGAYVGFAPDYSQSVLGQVVSGAAVVQEAEKMFGGKAYIGDQARLTTFLDHAGNHAILHFHGHAEASDSFPDLSWMAFTAGRPVNPSTRQPANPGLAPRPGRLPDAELDSCLFAHRIYHAHFDADLVLLSACQTGLGKIAPGEGTLSLSRAFQAAGCPATVMSLWKVGDKGAAALMGYFLANIRAGQDKDEALANAKRTWLEKNAFDAFPYHWAGFVLTGNAEPVQLPGPWWRQGWVWVLMAAGVALTGWMIWRRR
ncbi:MAG: CHAT domain-containing protein [Saprospiraceae bacterium]|jgi:CHAT domain-containing protein|nr:CHAT domain-containing protein [Saprospiraceae bacterium]